MDFLLPKVADPRSGGTVPGLFMLSGVVMQLPNAAGRGMDL